MLKAIIILTVAAAAAAQDSTCVPVDYIADTFEAVRFEAMTSYHNISGGYRLLVSKEEPLDWDLYDFNSGRAFTHRPNGKCYVDFDKDGKVDVDDFLTEGTIAFTSDKLGFPATGYTLSSGNLDFKGILSTGCSEVFFGVYQDGVARTLQYNSNIQTENIDLSAIDQARAKILNGKKCKSTNVVVKIVKEA